MHCTQSNTYLDPCFDSPCAEVPVCLDVLDDLLDQLTQLLLIPLPDSWLLLLLLLTISCATSTILWQSCTAWRWQ
jgi:hypothetical protein